MSLEIYELSPTITTTYRSNAVSLVAVCASEDDPASLPRLILPDTFLKPDVGNGIPSLSRAGVPGADESGDAPYSGVRRPRPLGTGEPTGVSEPRMPSRIEFTSRRAI
jgi:hypothetical protein